MPNLHYQLVPCGKCEGEFYGPVGMTVEQVGSLADQIQAIEIAVANSHPEHQLNGTVLKRYRDCELPQY